MFSLNFLKHAKVNINTEKISFLDRLAGKIDFSIWLAVLHHIMVTEGIPLTRIIGLIADITNECAVIEFVPRNDPMFMKIARGREGLYSWYDQETFESICSERFEIIESITLAPSKRRLYHLEKRLYS